MESKRFARSSNAYIFGVCAGLAEYTGIPVWLMRVLWVLLVLASWLGFFAVVAYIVLAAVMASPQGAPAGEHFWHNVRGHNIKIAVATAFLCLGAYIIIEALFDFSLRAYLFPIGLIVGGVLLVVFAFGGGSKKS